MPKNFHNKLSFETLNEPKLSKTEAVLGLGATLMERIWSREIYSNFELAGFNTGQYLRNNEIPNVLHCCGHLQEVYYHLCHDQVIK